MTMTPPRAAAVLLTVLAASACAPRATSTVPSPASSAAASATAGAVTPAPAVSPGGRILYTPADIAFMSGMIGHHAQALVMAGMATTHGASPSVVTLASRIIAGQKDEIATMQRWLAERAQPVPQPDTSYAHAMAEMAGMAGMPGMDHAMMPGMLTHEQLMQLDAARGKQWDELFLRFMIQHHRGALTMVEKLMGTPGAGQDDGVFKFVSDINADQTTEVDRMTTMLANITLGIQGS